MSAPGVVHKLVCPLTLRLLCLSTCKTLYEVLISSSLVQESLSKKKTPLYDLSGYVITMLLKLAIAMFCNLYIIMDPFY